MKKIYLKPEMEAVKVNSEWLLSGTGLSNNTGGGTDTSTPFQNPAPKRPTPTF